MNLNKMLAVAAVLLFAVSVLTYRTSTTRAERFERGQKFLSQLNADNIHEIEIRKGEEVIKLRKANDSFVVASQHNYPAKNETINRFINDLLEISLEKHVGSGESLEKELEISGGEKTMTFWLRNDSGKDMVNFVVGKSSDDGRGNYVKRLDGDDSGIYLTSRGVYLTSSADSFLDKEIVDVAQTDIVRIEGKDFVIAEKDGSLQLENVPSGKKESSAVAQVKGMLTGLSFDKVYLADDEAVSGLTFSNTVKVVLEDNSSYLVTLAQKDDKHFLKIAGDIDMEKVRESSAISREESEEELKAKSEVLSRRDEIEDFNNFHGSWVYELSDYAAKKFLKTRSELVEDIKKDSEG